ncbi:hypothetical protein D3C84_742000 [compost metagenome]
MALEFCPKQIVVLPAQRRNSASEVANLKLWPGRRSLAGRAELGSIDRPRGVGVALPDDRTQIFVGPGMKANRLVRQYELETFPDHQPSGQRELALQLTHSNTSSKAADRLEVP